MWAVCFLIDPIGLCLMQAKLSETDDRSSRWDTDLFYFKLFKIYSIVQLFVFKVSWLPNACINVLSLYLLKRLEPQFYILVKQNKKETCPWIDCVPPVQLAHAGGFSRCHGYDGSFHLWPHDDQLHLSRRGQLRRALPARDSCVLVTEAGDLAQSRTAVLFSQKKWREV